MTDPNVKSKKYRRRKGDMKTLDSWDVYEFTSRPDVAEMLRALQEMQRNAEPGGEWQRMVEIGKFSPEGIVFLQRCLRRMAATATDLCKRISP